MFAIRSAVVGFCGPYGFGIPCRNAAVYLRGIADPCHRGDRTEGAQQLNEDGDIEIFIVGQ